MSDCAPEGSGKMVAVMNADPALIEQICRKVATETGQIVAPANYNTPQQIVIGGETEAVDQAVVQLQEAGVRRCVPLKVSGPFHTPLLKQAASDLKAELARVSFSPMRLPKYSTRLPKNIPRKNILKFFPLNFVRIGIKIIAPIP